MVDDTGLELNEITIKQCHLMLNCFNLNAFQFWDVLSFVRWHQQKLSY